MKIPFRLVSIFSFILLAVSCLKKEPTAWDVNLKSPLINTSLTLQNLSNNDYFQNDENGNLFLNIEVDFPFLPDDSLVRLDDLIFQDSVNTPINLSIPPGSEFFNIVKDVTFNAGDARLTYLYLSGGLATISASSTINQPVIFDYFVEQSLNINGQQLGENDFMLQAGSIVAPANYTKMTPLGGFGINLTGPSGNSYNQTRVVLNAKTSPDGGVAAVNENQTLFRTQTVFSNIEPYFVKGYFGSREIVIAPITNNIDFLNNISGQLSLSEAELSLEIINTVGADFQFRIDEVTGIKTQTGEELSLVGFPINQTVQMNRAQQIPSSFSNQYTPFIRNYVLNSSNSNIISFIEHLPNAIRIKGKTVLNPLGNISSGNDFFYNDKKGLVKLKIKIPLKLKANQLALNDTIVFTPIDEANLSRFKGGFLSVFAQNNYPFDLNLNLALLDEEMNILTNISASQPIAAGLTNDLNAIAQFQNSRVNFLIPESLKEQLGKTRFLGIKATVNSVPTNEFVQLFQQSACHLTISADFKYEMQVD